MEINFQFIIALVTQAVMVSAIIANNKTTVGHLKEQNKELKEWLTKLQETVNNLRIKIGK